MLPQHFPTKNDPNISDDLDARLSPLFEAVRNRLDTLWSESFADLGVPDGRLADARRFARSHLLGMLVQRQLPSAGPDPSLELLMLSRATLQVMLSTEPI